MCPPCSPFNHPRWNKLQVCASLLDEASRLTIEADVEHIPSATHLPDTASNSRLTVLPVNIQDLLGFLLLRQTSNSVVQLPLQVAGLEDESPESCVKLEFHKLLMFSLRQAPPKSSAVLQLHLYQGELPRPWVEVPPELMLGFWFRLELSTKLAMSLISYLRAQRAA